MEKIDYDALKKKGFLSQRQEGFFLFRARGAAGNYNGLELSALINISKKYGQGIIHATTRQGLEIPFIKYEDIKQVEKEISAAGIYAGTSGARVRATTCCPGNNWCKRGLVDTFGFLNRIENELGIKCATDLPHKFKIAISGCPNKCTRAEVSDIGIHGAIDTTSPDKKIGYAIYLGGSGGMAPRAGLKLDRVFTSNEALRIVENVAALYKKHAKPRQRLGSLIEEFGEANFVNTIFTKKTANPSKDLER